MSLPTPVVFIIGVADARDHYWVKLENFWSAQKKCERGRRRCRTITSAPKC